MVKFPKPQSERAEAPVRIGGRFDEPKLPKPTFLQKLKKEVKLVGKEAKQVTKLVITDVGKARKFEKEEIEPRVKKGYAAMEYAARVRVKRKLPEHPDPQQRALEHTERKMYAHAETFERGTAKDVFAHDPFKGSYYEGKVKRKAGKGRKRPRKKGTRSNKK